MMRQRFLGKVDRRIIGELYVLGQFRENHLRQKNSVRVPPPIPSLPPASCREDGQRLEKSTRASACNEARPARLRGRAALPTRMRVAAFSRFPPFAIP